MELVSTITCRDCGRRSTEAMPTDAERFSSRSRGIVAFSALTAMCHVRRFKWRKNIAETMDAALPHPSRQGSISNRTNDRSLEDLAVRERERITRNGLHAAQHEFVSRAMVESMRLRMSTLAARIASQ
jgi:hypothetical protein